MEIIINDFGIEWKRKDGIVHKADYDELIKAYERQIPKNPKEYGEKIIKLKVAAALHESAGNFETADILRYAIEAIEKQIPKEFIYKEIEDKGKCNICPACNNIIHYYKNDYCHRCGQRINWKIGSVEND